jgi:hypothetical protein
MNIRNTLQMNVPDLSSCRIEVQPNEEFVTLSFYQKEDGQWQGSLHLGFDRIPQLIIDLQDAKPLVPGESIPVTEL